MAYFSNTSASFASTCEGVIPKPHIRVFPVSEVGLRFYNPESGRWPNRDMLEEYGGKNLYRFVSNDSICKIDLLGLKTVPYLFVTLYKGSYTYLPLPSQPAPKQNPLKLIKKIIDGIATIDDIICLFGEAIATSTTETEVPDCYIVVDEKVKNTWHWEGFKDRPEQTVSLPYPPAQFPTLGEIVEIWKLSLTIEFYYSHTIEWKWGPDPDDPCCE